MHSGGEISRDHRHKKCKLTKPDPKATADGGKQVKSALTNSLASFGEQSTSLQKLRILDQNSTLVQRPGVGTLGIPIALIANYFILEYKDDFTIYHYDVEIVSERGHQRDSKKRLPPPHASGKDVGSDVLLTGNQPTSRIGKIKNREVLKAIMKHRAFRRCRSVYDGRKNLYTNQLLPIKDKLKLTVSLDREMTDAFLVTIQPTQNTSNGKFIEFKFLSEFYESLSCDVPEDVLLFMDIMLHHRDPFVPEICIGRSFFSTSECKKGPLDVSSELWHGYYERVHLTEKGPAVLINTSAKAFRTSGFVIDCASEILGFDVTSRARLSSQDIFELSQRLTRVKVEVTHLPYRRRYVIDSVTRDSAQDLEVKISEEKKLSVAQYFGEKYKVLRFPYLPCLQVAKSKQTYLPMEVCVVFPGQPILGKLNSAVTKKITAKTALEPTPKFNEIVKYANRISSTSGDRMNAFGMSMRTTPLRLSGRVMAPPSIVYREDSVASVHVEKNGSWRMDGKHFLKTTRSVTWVLLSFSRHQTCSIERLNDFAKEMASVSQECGLTFGIPVAIKNFNERNTVLDALQFSQKRRSSFALVVLSPTDDYHTYEEVKYIADIQLGLVTQCVNEKVILERNVKQVIFNLCLKINSKLGGINHRVSHTPGVFRDSFMVIGADVSHAPRGSVSPSIAAVVGSLDDLYAKYSVSCTVQRNPDESKFSQEIILKLESMIKQILSSYVRTNDTRPSRVVFFRDGVSESQFRAVFEKEIPLVKRAFQETFNSPLSLTFIVVQKRHQTRFIPRHPQDGVGRGGNVPPGTIVDTAITHPVLFDFFICSHESIRGTSKPTHYSVIYDDNKFTADAIQTFCYYLCHAYVRCNRSISIPAPVMYAHLAAARAKKYVDLLLKRQRDGPRGSEGARDSLHTEMEDAVEKISSLRTNMFFV